MLEERQPVVRSQFAFAASIAVLVVAPAFTIWLIARYGVNTIVGDQIEIGRFLLRNHDRMFPRLGDLFAQHNESRKFFPRILFFYLARLTHWNVKYEMAVSFLMACGVVANIALLSRRLLLTALAAMLIFSPVQWWNWLFGIQVVVFAPILMLTTALVVLGRANSPRRSSWRVIAAAVLSIIATFSYANGMLVWLVLIVPLWKRWRALTFWAIAASITIGLYFYDYHKPAGHPALTSPFTDPVHFCIYMLAFLGQPLSWARSVLVAAVIGTLGLIVFAVLLVLNATEGGAARLNPAAAIAIGLYAIASAGMTAVGRLGLTLPQALEPRYSTFSIYLFVAVVLLIRRRTGALAVVIVALHILAVRTGWPEMELSYRERLLARTAEQFALVSPDRAALAEFVSPYTQRAVETIDGLSRIGYINPPPIRSDLVTRLRRDDTARYGAVEHVASVGRGMVGIRGWALLPGSRVADGVLVTRATPDGEHLVAISIRTALDHPDIGPVGWFARMPAAALQSGTTLRAWSYDSATQTAYRLRGGIRSE